MAPPSLPAWSSRSELTQNVLASFASSFTQESRLFKLEFSEDSDIAPDLLLPHRMRGIERIFGTYLYQVEVLSSDAYVSADEILAQSVQLSILLADSTYRMVAGVVTSFGSLSSDGGFSRYVLHIEPCLAVLAHSYNACVRQDMSVSDVLLDVLDRHTQNNDIVKRSFQVELRLTGTLPILSYATQYESDLHYIERLMAQYGLIYFFEFRNDNGHPVHLMVITDDHYTIKPGLQPKIRFAGAHAGALADDAQDTLTQWSGMQRIQTGMVSLTSFEYKNVSVDRASARSRVNQGKAGNQLSSTLHDFDPQTHYYARGGDNLDRHAQIRQEAYDFQAQQYTGVTGVRGLAPATSIEISGHPVHDQENSEQRHFVIVTMVCEAVNNLGQENEAALADLLRARPDIPAVLAPWFGNGQSMLDDTRHPYRNLITCVRRDIPIRPRYAHTDYTKPAAPAMVTATVVGPEGEEVFTDEYGRVKIEHDFQFPDNHPQGTANKNEKSSTWVRVLCISAGQNWGSQFIPRIGQEVAILFLHGDIDTMICIGVMPNGTHRKPFFAGVGDLPANKMLSGIKGKENQGTGYNQLVLDDSTKQISTHLMSSHAQTKLSQGWLGTPRKDGKSDPTGEGFNLETDAAGAIRTAGPLLITTEAQRRGGGQQLMRDAALQVLTAALALVERTSDFAAEVEANQVETGRGNQFVEDDNKPGAKADAGHQTHLKEALDNLERGYNNDPQGKTGQGSQRGGQSILALSSPDGVAIASQKSATLATGANLDQVAQRDINQTSGRRWIHNAGESVSLFVDGSKAKIKYTFKITVAKGDMQQRVLSGKYVVEANDDIVHKTKGKYIIEAEKGVWIKGEGGMIHVGNQIDLHNPDVLSIKAADYDFAGPAGGSTSLTLPTGTPKPCSWKNKEAVSKGDASVPIN